MQPSAVGWIKLRIIKETNQEFKDETHIIYVNSSKQDDTELGRLMHDLHCKNADDMYSKVLEDRVRKLKETQKGVERMCKELEDLIELATKDARKEIAISLAKMGMPAEQIAEVVEIKAATVRLWLDKDLNPIKE